MKIRIQIKDPDGIYESIKEAASKQLRETTTGLSDDEIDLLQEGRAEHIEDRLGDWIRHGEYITVEIDLDAGKGVVVKQ